jgi:hypothetical protein
VLISLLKHQYRSNMDSPCRLPSVCSMLPLGLRLHRLKKVCRIVPAIEFMCEFAWHVDTSHCPHGHGGMPAPISPPAMTAEVAHSHNVADVEAREGADVVECPISPPTYKTRAPDAPARPQQPAPYQLHYKDRGVTVRFLKDLLSAVQHDQQQGGGSKPPSTSGAVARRSKPGAGDVQLKTRDIVERYIKPTTAHMPISFVEAVCGKCLDVEAVR